MGLIEPCIELAEVLNHRLASARENLKQTRREKLLINLIIFASLQTNSNQEKSQMLRWLQSLFQESEILNHRTAAILMTGVC